MKKSNSINWITPFNVTIMKSKCPKEHVNFMIEAVTLLLDNEILCEELDASDGLVGNVTNEVHVPQLAGTEGINNWIKEQAKKYVKIFNKYDLYSKTDEDFNIDNIKEYYENLINKFFTSTKLKW